MRFAPLGPLRASICVRFASKRRIRMNTTLTDGRRYGGHTALSWGLEDLNYSPPPNECTKTASSFTTGSPMRCSQAGMTPCFGDRI